MPTGSTAPIPSDRRRRSPEDSGLWAAAQVVLEPVTIGDDAGTSLSWLFLLVTLSAETKVCLNWTGREGSADPRGAPTGPPLF